jgi:hypothetical protein
MKHIDQVKPYTYLVKHKTTGKVYYGSRCQNSTKFNRTPAEDFWNHYTTSSENINAIIEQEGKDAFDYEIRRTFNTVEEMANWETRVLVRSHVLERQDIWFNANIAGKKILTEAGAKKISKTHKDKPKSDEHRKKIKLSNIGKNKGKMPTDEHRQKNSEAHKGEKNAMYGPCSAERAANISRAKKAQKLVAHNKGIPMSEEQKAAIRATKAATKTYLTCENCGKTIYKPNYFQHHGDKCKHNLNKDKQ